MILYTVKNEAALRRRIYSVDNDGWGWKVSVRPNVFSREIFSPAKETKGSMFLIRKNRGTPRTGTRNTSTPAVSSKSKQQLRLWI
jgi:hypothetical protein